MKLSNDKSRVISEEGGVAPVRMGADNVPDLTRLTCGA